MTALIGRSVTRKEDPELVTGRGRFAADLRLPGTVHMTYVRSTEAHARLGFALFTLGRREEGRDHVALSVAIDGRDPEVWAWFVQQEHELGELDVARDVALEGARRFPKNAHLAQWCDELQAR